MSDAISFQFRVEKASPTGRYVSGWLSVAEKDGATIEDTQGDRVTMDELRKAFHAYMAGARAIKKQHSGEPIGSMVECVIVDDDFAKAHGITHKKRGVWGTAEITDESVKKDAREGRFGGFSIGGRGKRVDIAKSSPDSSDVHSDTVLSAKRVRFELAARKLKRARARAR